MLFLMLTTSYILGGDHTLPMLEISPRETGALSGSAFSDQIQTVELVQREKLIFQEIEKGNIPAFLRELAPVEFSTMVAGLSYDITFYCTPDYLAIGSDSDYFLMPMTPMLAQKVADQLGGLLPTRKMVNLIWDSARLKISPQPIPPSSEMVTAAVFKQHHNMVSKARKEFITGFPLGQLVAGHKKDVIVSECLVSKPEKVVIYGWHYPTGEAIQPLYSGHINWYVDYSHGIRLIHNTCLVNGVSRQISEILSDPVLYQLLSDEAGPLETTRYDTSQVNYPH